MSISWMLLTILAHQLKWTLGDQKLVQNQRSHRNAVPWKNGGWGTATPSDFVPLGQISTPFIYWKFSGF